MLKPIGNVLNWYSKDPLLIRGLRDKLTLTAEFTSPRRRFVTIRLGTKWLDKLNPHSCVSISISDDPNNPRVIGYARVRSVKKTIISALTEDELRKNIGAKTRKQVQLDMQSVYNNGQSFIHPNELITVIELEA